MNDGRLRLYSNKILQYRSGSSSTAPVNATVEDNIRVRMALKRLREACTVLAKQLDQQAIDCVKAVLQDVSLECFLHVL